MVVGTGQNLPSSGNTIQEGPKGVLDPIQIPVDVEVIGFQVGKDGDLGAELVKRLAVEVGFEEISCSSEVAPLPKIVSRGETTVVDAYLNPVLRNYVAKLEKSLPGSQIRLMTSAGGLVPARSFRGRTLPCRPRRSL